MKSLVAYFSAGGKTAGIAKMMAQVTGSDLFEIRPAQPYTAGDLDRDDPRSRYNRERAEDLDVPMADAAVDLAAYDLVFLGFPLWHGAAPNIIRTFCKAYDWTGRNVALFTASGGDIEAAAEKLREHMKGANIVHTQGMPGG